MKRFYLAVILFVSCTLQAQTVYEVGSQQKYKTINEAIQAIPADNSKEAIVKISKGIYQEKVFINKPHVTLLGESRDSTQIIYPILNSQWAEECKANHRSKEEQDRGRATVNIHEEANDCSLVNLTIYNNYGSTIEQTTSHQFTVFGRATRTITLHCNIYSDGNDNVALWYPEGMYYHEDCFLRCTGVDYLCPRGWSYTVNCQFYGSKSAQLWHDGRRNPNKKSVLVNCSFDACEKSWLGRYHHDHHMYLINCTFSEMIDDNPIQYAYHATKEPDNLQWGHRVYYYGAKGAVYNWQKDNLHEAAGSPQVTDITPQWTFDGQWNPTSKVNQLKTYY